MFCKNNLNNADVQAGTEKASSAVEDVSICPERADDVFNLDRGCVPSLNPAIPEITSENTLETSSSSKQATDNEDDPFKFFEQNGFGKIGNYYDKKIKSWCAELSSEIVIVAMKLALENGSNRWNYVEAVLKDWISKGYQTVKEILDAQLVFKVQKQKETIARPVRIELVPEWFDKDKQPETPVFDLDFEAKKRLFEERLKAHW